MAKKKFVIETEAIVDEVKQPKESVSVETEEPKATATKEIVITGRKQTKKETHKVYSFWANKEQIEVWKCYQEANPELEKAEDLGLKAIEEYIKNHPLSGDDAVMYELKLKAKGLENSMYR